MAVLLKAKITHYRLKIEDDYYICGYIPFKT